jgi:hypothetical protein
VGNVEALAVAPDAQVTVVAPTFVPVRGSKLFIDSDGDRYRVAISGPGTLNAALLDPDGDGKGTIDQLVLANTRASTSVSVTLVKKVGDGIIPIGDVTGTGKLASFTAPNSNLVVNGFTYSGKVGLLKVRDVLRPDPILTDPQIKVGGVASDATKIVARNIADGAIIDSTARISMLKTKSIGQATLAAPKLSKLITTAGAMNADAVIPGAMGKVSVTGGAFGGDLVARNFGAVAVTGGDFAGSLTSVTPAATLGTTLALASLKISGGKLTGDLRMFGKVGAITVGDIADATITAAKIASLTAKNVANSTILAGADLGDDRVLGGGNDTFGPGSIGPVLVKGNMTGSVLAAGLDPMNGIFHDAGDTILGGTISKIASLSIKGQATGNYFAAGRFVPPVKIHGAVVNPATDPQFFVG